MDKDEGRKVSDPIDNDDSELNETWRNTTPDFYRPEKEKKPRKERMAEKNSAGKAQALDAEKAAAAGPSASRSSLMNGGESEARGMERGGFYTGKGGAASAVKDTAKGKTSVRGKMKGKGPFFLVGAVISFAMIMIASSQVVAPFALVSNALDEFNSLRTSMRLRGNYLMRFQMKSDRNIPLTTGGVFSKEKFKISKKTQKKLAKHNITYSEDGGTRHLIYKNDITGETFKVVANEADVGRVSGSITLDDALKNSDDFFRDHDLSTRTLKGHFAGWFDSVSEKFHKRIVNSRNRFKDVDDDADDAEIQEAAKKTGIDEDVKASTTDGEEKEDWDRVDTDPDDSTKKIEHGNTEELDVGDDSLAKNADAATVNTAMTSRAKKVLAASGALANSSQMACAVIKGIGAIANVATAIQRANIINYATASLEMIHKTQAGDGGNEIHYLMNGLSQKGDTKGISETGQLTDAKSGTAAMESPAFNHFFGGKPVSADDPVARKYSADGAFSTMLATNMNVNYDGVNSNEVLLTGEDEGGWTSWWAGFLGFFGIGNKRENQYKWLNSKNGGVDGSDVKLPTLRANINDKLNSANKMATYKKCLMFRAGGAFVNAAVDVVTLLTTGPLAFFKSFAETLIQQAIQVMLMTAISVVISALIPRLVEWLAKDLMTNMMGEDAAYALDAGVHMYLGEQQQASSGKPGTEAEAIAMHNASQEIIAEEARYDRLTHSPFDISNKNTFLGSIVYSLVPIGLSLHTSPTTLISRATSMVGNAINSVLPVVNAADEGVHFRQELNNNCSALSEFGLVGDAYCNPYYVSYYASDHHLLEEDPYDIFRQICADNFENGCNMEGGGETDKDNENEDNEKKYGYNPKIKENSELGKWVVACSARTTQFGYMDGNEYQIFHTGASGIDTALEAGTGMLPFIGDAVDAFESAADAENMKWSSGEACISDESKLFSAYSEDQRWMENAGIVEDSAVAVYLDEFYKKYPLDNSEEGIIARYSGMTKDQVEETLGLVELFNFVANYDSTGLGPKADIPAVEEKWQYEDDSIVAGVFPEMISEVRHYVIHGDIRNRTVLV